MPNILLDDALHCTKLNLDRICGKLGNLPIVKLDTMTSNYAFLIGGTQITSSLSPFIHNYSARKDSIPFNYILLNLEKNYYSIVEILEYIERSENIFGANVTMPYKIEVYNELSKSGKLDKSAVIAGSVNTLYKDAQGQLRGMNTDIDGIMNPIAQSLSKKNIKEAIVLGGGGATRAIIIGLIQLGIEEISIYNRTIENIETFITTLQKNKNELNMPDNFSIEVHKYDVTDDTLSEISIKNKSILINALPFGFKENMPKMPIRESILEKNIGNIQMVFDIAYTLDQIDTPLLQYIKTNYPGIETYDGIDMLVEQARKGFTAWTKGITIDAEKIKNLLKKTNLSL